MSTTAPLDPTQQQPTPFPPVIQQQPPYKPHSGHGSVGPVIGVLAVIMVLGVIAVMIGKLCSGRRVMGHIQYDFEGWVESKCSTCIDGRVGPVTRRESVPVVVVVESNRSNHSSAPAEIPADEEQVSHDPQTQEEHILHDN